MTRIRFSAGVNFQILDRRPFEPEYYYKKGRVEYIGAAVGASTERSRLERTKQAHPGMVTRIITKFEGYTGRYVWQSVTFWNSKSMEMMRPYDVLPLG